MTEDSNKNIDELLASWLEQTESEVQETLSSDESNSTSGPLSRGQARLYFLEQLDPGNPVYHYAEHYVFDQLVSHETLSDSFAQACHRHESTRTVFRTVEGSIYQEVLEALAPEIESFSDHTDLEAHMLSFGRKAFDLEHGPLARMLLADRNGRTEVLICMHHIITDKWSMNILRQDWSAIMRAAPGDLTAQSSQYLQHAIGQGRADYRQVSIDCWQEKLQSVEQLQLQTCRARPSRQSYRGSFARKRLDPTLSHAINRLQENLECTGFDLFLAVTQTLLSRYCNQDDVVLGTPISNRTDEAWEELIGFFNETVVLRQVVQRGMSFSDLVESTKKQKLEAFAHADLPFDEIVRLLGYTGEQDRNPIFQHMFLYHEVPAHPVLLPDVSYHYETYDLGVAKFDLSFYVAKDDEGHELIIEYATDLYTEPRIHELLDSFAQVLSSVSEDPALRLSEIKILSAEQRSRCLEAGRGGSLSPPQEDIFSLIASGVELASPAVYWQGEEHAYSSLLAEAKVLGTALAAHDSPRIGIYMPRSVSMVRAILACLYAGKAYVPMDPKYPTQRLRWMIEDAELGLILYDRSTPELQCESWDLAAKEEMNDRAMTTPTLAEDPEAYIIFTSGSTGRPKPVLVRQSSLRASTQARFSYYGEGAIRFLLMSSFSFDSSVAGIFWSLMSGGCLILPPERIEQDMEALSHLIRDSRATHSLMLPSLYQLLISLGDRKAISQMTAMIVAGESCNKTLVQEHHDHFPDIALYNEYGPTEATVWSSVARLRPSDDQITIGRSIPGCDILLLDDHGELVPYGQLGEICVSGYNLSAGYLGEDTGLVPRRGLGDSPFGQMYRTGDQGYWTPEGDLIFCGRKDEQVKIRGFRVELAELESQLNALRTEYKSVVLAEDQGGVKRLKAYIQTSLKASETEIRSSLHSSLPDHMVPEEIFLLEELPLMPNGKIDRQALLALKHDRSDDAMVGEQMSPLTEVESRLLSICREVLSNHTLSIEDHFFRSGGDSLKSIILVSKAKENGLALKPTEIFRHPILRDLAAQISTEAEAKSVNAIGTAPMLPMQVWHFDLHRSAPKHWLQGMRMSIDEAVAEDQLRSALDELWHHHHGLRARFDPVDKHMIIGEADGRFPWSVMATEQSDQAAIASALSQDCHAPILAAYWPGQRSLVILIHHLLIDAVSWSILLRDLDALLDGKSSDDLMSSCSLIDWAEGIRSEKLQAWRRDSVDHIARHPMTTMSYLESDVEISTLRYAQTVDSSIETHKLCLLAVALASKKIDAELVVEVESIGRLHEQLELDASQTVGWFTSVYPISPDQSEPSEELLIRRILQRIDSVQHQGIDYATALYPATREAKGNSRSKKIVFNYLGESLHESYRRLHEVSFMTEGLRAPTTERDSALEVNIRKSKEGIELELRYDKSIEELVSHQFAPAVMAYLDSLQAILLGAQQDAHSDVELLIDDEDLSTLEGLF